MLKANGLRLTLFLVCAIIPWKGVEGALQVKAGYSIESTDNATRTKATSVEPDVGLVPVERIRRRSGGR